MREWIKNMKISYLLAAVLYIVFGVVLILWPNTTGDVICTFLGAVLLVYGAITVISFFVHDSRMGAFGFDLVVGILAIALAILFLVRPEVLLSFLPVALGIYIVIDALLNLKRALDMRRMAYDRWWVVLALSLISAVLGVVILLRPVKTAALLIQLIGGVFVYTGLSDLWAIFKLNRISKLWQADHPIEVDPIDIE